MQFSRIGGQATEDHFWQVLLVCSGEEFLRHGEVLVGSCDMAAPETRIMVCLTDDVPQADALLTRIADRCFGVALYRITAPMAGGAIERDPRWMRWRIAGALLAATRLPVLLVSPGTLVRGSLAALAAELQSADIAFGARFSRPKVRNRVITNVVWLGVNDRVQWFLRELDRSIGYRFARRDGAASNDAEKQAVYRTLVRCGRLLRFVNLPSRYADRDQRPDSLIWAPPRHGEVSEDSRDHAEDVVCAFWAEPDVVVLAPRQDLGTKTKLADNNIKTRVKRLARPGRIYWRHAPRLIAAMLQRDGRQVRILPVGQWDIGPELLDRLAPADVFVPHTLRAQFDHPRARYYMQELLPSLFTQDSDGWGPSARWSGSRAFETVPVDRRFAGFAQALRDGRITKAPQKDGGAPPAFDVLAPLQVPGDDALIHHSDTTLEAYVTALVAFGQTTGTRVLFKRHPYDRSGFFREMRKAHSSATAIFVETGHVHDLIGSAKAVVVINSGVGFEAMLYGKPVLSFGRAAYDAAVTPVRPGGLADAYRTALAEPDAARTARYDRFASWYVYQIGMKLDEPILNLAWDRLALAEPEPNPVVDNVLRELNYSWKGLGRTTPPAANLLERLGAELRLHRTRFVKRARMQQRRLSKAVVAPVVAWPREMLLSPLPDDIFVGKRVALVGNAASLRETSFGAEIDAHDLVVRMNVGYPLLVRKDVPQADIPPGFLAGTFVDRRSSGAERHHALRPDTPAEVAQALTHAGAVGRRTDIWSCSTSDRSRQLFFAPLFDCTTVACHPQVEHLSLRLLLGRKVCRLPSGVCFDLRRTRGIEPTSGLIWIEHLRRSGCTALSLYGFDFFATGHINRTTTTTLEAQGKWPHDPVAERDHVTALLATDARILLRQPPDAGAQPVRRAAE